MRFLPTRLHALETDRDGQMFDKTPKASSLVTESTPMTIDLPLTFPQYPIDLSSAFAITTMLHKLGNTVRGKLDHIQSRLSSQDGASADQPGSHISSRDGGVPLHSADFPTQADFFRFRKQRGVNFGALYSVPIR